MEKKKKPHEPSEEPKYNPEINPMDIDEPLPPPDDSDIIDIEDPFENPPEDEPVPGED